MRSLNEIEYAHRSVGGTGRGRRYATQQINHAYAVLLSSQFQGYCRDLHSESTNHLVGMVTPVSFQDIVRAAFEQGRKLDHGNPNAGNIGSDFGLLLGGKFWSDVEAVLGKKRCDQDQRQLAMLNLWRNAIAHQDFDPAKLGGISTLGIRDVREWRRALERLTVAFDAVMCNHVLSVIGVAPW